MGAAIGERVRQCIADRFGSAAKQGDVAAAVGMTQDAFSRALSGGRNFAAIELARVADYLGTSIYWLVTGEEDPHAVRVAARHTFDHVAHEHETIDWASERNGIDTVTTAYVQAFGRGEPPLAFTALPADPAEARRRLAATNPHFVRDFAETVETVFGVEVVRIPEASRSYSLSVAGHRVIVVPPHVNWFFQNFSIAHELAHFATEQLEPLASAIAVTANAERSANAYAAELLLPEGELRNLDWVNLSSAELADNLWAWGVSTNALRTRLAALQIVPSDPIRELLQLSTQRVLRRHRQGDASMWFDPVTDRMERANTRRFPAALLAAHTTAVSAGELRADYLAWMIGIDASELEAQLAPAFGSADLEWLADSLGLGEPPSNE